MGFEGHWRVREHVFDAEGRALGTVRQRRILQATGPQRFRLTQHCTPDASLDNHPMAQFAGTHVFELQVDGATRRYLGPAVVGSGQMLGPQTMWGEGIWPIFGHAFQSYAVNLSNKQLTGGIFSTGNALMAQIVGIAQPETDEDVWPELCGPYRPDAVGERWSGTRTILRPDGEVLRTHPVQRTYTDAGWIDRFDEEQRAVTVNETAGTLAIEADNDHAPTTGVLRRCGWSLELEWVRQDGLHTRAFEALDSADGHLAIIQRHYQNLQLAGIEVLRLTPEAPHDKTT